MKPIAGPVRILHLEDNPNDAELIRSMLESQGVASEIKLARSREEFLSALDRGSFDLVISDYTIPSFDGKEALAVIRKKFPEIPFVYVSGTIGEEAAIDALLNGATDYILKNNLKRLVPAVRRVLREIAERQEREKTEKALGLAEAKLRQAQKMEAIGRLAGGVAHDFNNLLTAIVGLADLTILELPANDSIRKDIEEIKETSLRAASLTRQLLAFSRRQVIQPRMVDLNEVVLALKKMLCRLIEEDVEIKIVPLSAPAVVRADPSQLEQLIVNLSINARDAMSNGGVLTIQVAPRTLDETFVLHHPGSTSGEYLLLTIGDNGTGMTEEVKSHLFEPFFTTKERGKGTGLGLATCYGIVKQNGGYIALESELGKGTVVQIYLPRADDRAEPLKTRSGPDKSVRGSETVLVAEDEAAVRRLVVRVLRMQGYTVLEAVDGAEALDVVQQDTKKIIRMVVADAVMPKLGGKKLAAEIKAIRSDIKVLFTSGHTDESIARHGVLDPEIEFISKPFEPQALARKVREVLDKG
ncbi:MAG: response regulator [Elusimicrobia bacterium]|nr:response regulator [Elusimicrobiota bacterium]